MTRSLNFPHKLVSLNGFQPKAAQLKLILHSIAVLLCIVQHATVYALDLDVRSERSNALDFSLQIEHSQIDFENDSINLTANLNRVGIVSIDVPSTGPQFGLMLGYSFADFSDNPSYESIDMDGYYIGVSVRGYLIKSQRLSLSLSGYYLYQRVDGGDDQRSASLSWDEFSATALFEYHFQGVGIMFAGIGIDSIEAHYRESGTTNSSVDLDNENEVGGVVGFNYHVNKLEYLRISYQQAARKGATLSFGKLF